MAKRKISLTLDGKTYERFRDHCEKNCEKMSTRIEWIMNKWMDSWDNRKLDEKLITK